MFTALNSNAFGKMPAGLPAMFLGDLVAYLISKVGWVALVINAYGPKRVWRKLYAQVDNVCKLFVLGFDLCIIKYHVKCNVGRGRALGVTSSLGAAITHPHGGPGWSAPVVGHHRRQELAKGKSAKRGLLS